MVSEADPRTRRQPKQERRTDPLVNQFVTRIEDTLQGNIPDLQDMPKERLGFHGIGAFLEMYDQTSGKDREAIIQAMGKIIETGETIPIVRAQVVDLAADLDLSQLEPSITKLKRMKASNNPYVVAALSEYEAFRVLARREIP